MDTKIRPVGRIDYLDTKGNVGERFYCFNEDDFLRTVKEDNYHGVPMVVNVYSDKNGKTIPLDFVLDFDPPVQGFHIIDYNDMEKIFVEPKCKVYSLTEHWANDGENGMSTQLFLDKDDAAREFNTQLAAEKKSGLVADWLSNPELVIDASTSEYECYIDGRHSEYHYSIRIEEKELQLGGQKLVTDTERLAA